MADKSKEEYPQTAGELRRLIRAKKFKWTVDPRLRDGDPIPNYKRGGVPPREGTPELEPVKDLTTLLRKNPPANPLLRARWVELKLLLAKEQGTLRGSSPIMPHPQEKKAREKEKKR